MQIAVVSSLYLPGIEFNYFVEFLLDALEYEQYFGETIDGLS